jgi:hypothetical protein
MPPQQLDRKSIWPTWKLRTVAVSVGGPGDGALHGPQASLAQASVPAPQTLEHARVATGTEHGPQASSVQVWVPAPQVLEHARVAVGTTHGCQ